ncbi:MAG: pentapeptide repeat-containing protein [Chloroflexota bacterium]|nr:pentapeptide repeat-containing protein [Chloroflexota bacterium]
MANPEHVELLKQGVEVWNKWRKENPDVQPDLSNAHFYKDFHAYHLQGVNLSGVDLTKTVVTGDFKGANFSSAILRGAEFSVAYLDDADLSNTDLRDSFFEGTTFEGVNLSGADLRNTTIIESSISGDTVNYVNLSEVNLSSANLSKMDLQAFDFSRADLSRANLQEADLRWANLSEANLHTAKLNGAIISWANLSEADLSGADLTGCKIYAISAWNVRLDNTTRQKNLIITRDDETTVTVDDLEVAQFIYLLLNNKKIRHVINTITSKVVLILGRFLPERKIVLDNLRDELRNHDLIPVVFDFDSSAKRDLTETISTLAHMARFVIADLTDAKSIPQELQAIVPHLPSVPVQPILQAGTKEYAMFEHYERYPWVLPIYRYRDIPTLLASIKDHIIKPIEQRAREKEKTRKLEEEVRLLKEKVRELEGK